MRPSLSRIAILAASAVGVVAVSSCDVEPQLPPEATAENPRVFVPRYDLPNSRGDGTIISVNDDPFIIIDAETGCEYIFIPAARGDSITARIGKDRLPICNPPKE